MMYQKQQDPDTAWCEEHGNSPSLTNVLKVAYVKSAETDTGGAETPDHEDLDEEIEI